jgi:hypothetical protein
VHTVSNAGFRYLLIPVSRLYHVQKVEPYEIPYVIPKFV